MSSRDSRSRDSRSHSLSSSDSSSSSFSPTSPEEIEKLLRIPTYDETREDPVDNNDCAFSTLLLEPLQLSGQEIQYLEGARTNDVGTVQRILDGKKIRVDTKNSLYRTALHLASANGHLEVVHILLSAKANVDSIDKYGMTPLMWAAIGGQVEVVRALIEAKASMKITSKIGLTVVHCATLTNQLKTLRVIASLVNSGTLSINSKCQGDHTALHLAAERGYTKLAKHLLKLKSDVREKNKIGQTALHLAAGHGHSSIIEAILSQGSTYESDEFNVNERDKNGSTAVMLASSAGHVCAVQSLLQADGIDLTIADNKGMTALMQASLNGHDAVVAELLRHDCNKNAQDENKNTALHLAISREHVEVVRQLVMAKCDATIVDQRRQTPLHMAVDVGNQDVVGVLLTASASQLKIKDLNGKTPLAMAARSDLPSIVDMIIKHERLFALLKNSNVKKLLPPLNEAAVDDPASLCEQNFVEDCDQGTVANSDRNSINCKSGRSTTSGTSGDESNARISVGDGNGSVLNSNNGSKRFVRFDGTDEVGEDEQHDIAEQTSVTEESDFGGRLSGLRQWMLSWSRDSQNNRELDADSSQEELPLENDPKSDSTPELSSSVAEHNFTEPSILHDDPGNDVLDAQAGELLSDRHAAIIDSDTCANDSNSLTQSAENPKSISQTDQSTTSGTSGDESNARISVGDGSDSVLNSNNGSERLARFDGTDEVGEDEQHDIAEQTPVTEGSDFGGILSGLRRWMLSWSRDSQNNSKLDADSSQEELPLKNDPKSDSTPELSSTVAASLPDDPSAQAGELSSDRHAAIIDSETCANDSNNLTQSAEHLKSISLTDQSESTFQSEDRRVSMSSVDGSDVATVRKRGSIAPIVIRSVNPVDQMKAVKEDTEEDELMVFTLPHQDGVMDFSQLTEIANLMSKDDNQSEENLTNDNDQEIFPILEISVQGGVCKVSETTGSKVQVNTFKADLENIPSRKSSSQSTFQSEDGVNRNSVNDGARSEVVNIELSDAIVDKLDDNDVDETSKPIDICRLNSYTDSDLGDNVEHRNDDDRDMEVTSNVDGANDNGSVFRQDSLIDGSIASPDFLETVESDNLESSHVSATVGRTESTGSFMSSVSQQNSRNRKRSFDSDREAERAMMELLWKLAVKQLKSDDWKKLAKYWEFSTEQIDAIQQQYTGSRSYRTHGYRLLTIWFQCQQQLTKLGVVISVISPDRANSTSIMGQLFEALTAIGRRKLAERVRMQCNKKALRKVHGSSCVIS